MKRRIIAALAIAASGPSLIAQEAPPLKPFTLEDGTPVRRATPVEKTPATPVPVPKATPAPAPAAPIPGGPAAEKPAAEKPAATKPPVKPFKVTTPGVPEIPDPTGEIRLAPSGTTMSADQIQISIADSYYAKQQFEMAAPEYEKYLGLYPTAPDRPVALFRLAEAYRRNGTVNAAKNTYEPPISKRIAATAPIRVITR